jgi:phosphoglycerate dehydrogenase-like enzyme
MKTRAAFFNNENWAAIDYVFAKGRRQKLTGMVDLYPEIISEDNFEQHAEKLVDLEVIFSTWGMPELSEQQIERLPALSAVFYAAGATDGFARPFLKKNKIVASAWLANAVPVAEFCVAQILLSCKGYFHNTADCRIPGKWRDGTAFKGRGVFEEGVALIGAGAISHKTRELLAPFNLNVVIIPSRQANRTISLEEAFSSSYIVSNHLPNRSDNIGILNGGLFRMMPWGATFINTGRGAQVNEPELIAVLKERPDLTALLDVTWPEPPVDDSELYMFPNVHLSSHIAGSMNNEVVRMADYMIEEFMRWKNGEALKYQISESMLMND